MKVTGHSEVKGTFCNFTWKTFAVHILLGIFKQEKINQILDLIIFET